MRSTNFALSALLLCFCSSALAGPDDDAAAALAIAAASNKKSEPTVTITRACSQCQCAGGGPCCCDVCHCSYDKACKKAIAELRPLVVGVDCDPPKGDWLSVRASSAELGKEFAGKILVGRPGEGTLWMIAKFPAGTTATSIASILRPVQATTYHPSPSPAPVVSYQPSYQPAYQPSYQQPSFRQAPAMVGGGGGSAGGC